MSRCVACDCILTSVDLRRKKYDGKEEDLCGHCREIAYYPDNIVTHTHVLENVTESLYVPHCPNTY